MSCDFGQGCAGDGQAEDGACRGADYLGVPGIDGVGREEDLLRAKGFCGADERAEVAGVLEAFEDEGDGLLLRRGRVKARDEDGRGDALRRCGFDGAGEDVAAEGKNAGGSEAEERRAIEDVLTAIAEEEGFEGEAGAESFGNEVLAFEAEEFAGLRRFPAEGGAQSLDAGVGLARDGCGRGHWDEASCVETQCTRRVADDRAEGLRPEAEDEIKSWLGK